jgi:hypothetical protein
MVPFVPGADHAFADAPSQLSVDPTPNGVGGS